MYVLDSSAIIDVIKDRPRGRKVEQIVGNSPLVTTSLCVHELLVGARSEQERFIHEGILSRFHILDYTMEAAIFSARFQQELAKKGVAVGIVDTLIAGICKANNAELVTLDRDFSKMKEIKTHIVG